MQHSESEYMDYLGNSWRCTYLNGALGHVPAEDKQRFEYEVTKLYYQRGEQATIKGDTFEAHIECTGRTSGIGAFYGAEFKATFESEQGKQNLVMIMNGPKASLN